MPARTKALLRAGTIYLLHSMSHNAASHGHSVSTCSLRAESAPERSFKACATLPDLARTRASAQRSFPSVPAGQDERHHSQDSHTSRLWSIDEARRLWGQSRMHAQHERCCHPASCQQDPPYLVPSCLSGFSGRCRIVGTGTSLRQDSRPRGHAELLHWIAKRNAGDTARPQISPTLVQDGGREGARPCSGS